MPGTSDLTRKLSPGRPWKTGGAGGGTPAIGFSIDIEVMPPHSGAISKSRFLFCCLRRSYDGLRWLSRGRLARCPAFGAGGGV